MLIPKLLCLLLVIGFSCGHVRRARREITGMIPLLQDEDGTDIEGMYMMEDLDGRGSRTDLQPCQMIRNNGQNNYDYNCGCNQQIGMDRPIGNLILNLTDCSNGGGLSIIWSQLEASLAPESIAFMGVGTLVLTNQTLKEDADSSIKKLAIFNSTVEDLNGDAFQGLKVLEELRFYSCKIRMISQHAVRKHEKLNTFEIIESTVGEVYGNAISNLSAINDFAISFSSIDEIKSDGIKLQITDEPLCTRSGRSLKENLELLDTCMESVLGRQSESEHDLKPPKHMTDSIMGRQIQGARDLNLPPFGNRFLLFKNTIGSIRSNAVSSNAFGFLILGGNQINLIESKAFNMQLQNPCEISAALLASNDITKLQNQALAGISNGLGSNNTTFISLNQNKFEIVKAQSFKIEKGIQIYAVDENIFKCECTELSGFLRVQNHLTSVQAELKMQIIEKANCTTGVDLKSFKYTCDEFSTVTPESHRNLTPTPPSGGAQSTFSHSNLTNVVVTGLVMIIINKIVP